MDGASPCRLSHPVFLDFSQEEQQFRRLPHARKNCSGAKRESAYCHQGPSCSSMCALHNMSVMTVTSIYVSANDTWANVNLWLLESGCHCMCDSGRRQMQCIWPEVHARGLKSRRREICCGWRPCNLVSISDTIIVLLVICNEIMTWVRMY